MSDKIPEFGKRFYALHICEGMTGENGPKKISLLVREPTLRNMDVTYQGKPVIFRKDHLDAQQYMDLVRALRTGDNVDIQGIVNKSFYNEPDGKHWVEFIVWDPAALAAIESGYGVSNSYFVTGKGPAGEWHAIPYDEEIMEGVYDHLLLTDSPRYEESQILTPEQFKQYNEDQVTKLASVTNKKEPAMFKIFNRQPVEKPENYKNLDVELPKTGKVMTFEKIVNDMDERMEKESKGEMKANMDHKVELHTGEVVNVGELLERHKAMHEENERMKNDLATYEEAMTEEKKVNDEDKQKEGESDEDFKKRMDAKRANDDKKRENETDEEYKKRMADKKGNDDKRGNQKDKEDRAKAIREKVAKIKNAPEVHAVSQVVNKKDSQEVIRTRKDAVNLGKHLFGTEEKK